MRCFVAKHLMKCQWHPKTKTVDLLWFVYLWLEWKGFHIHVVKTKRIVREQSQMESIFVMLLLSLDFQIKTLKTVSRPEVFLQKS